MTAPLATRRRKVYERLERQRVEVQLACTHPWIIEAPYAPSRGWLRASPEFRVCRTCGFTEQGWGCGFQILRHHHERLSREEAGVFRVGPEHPNHRFVRDGSDFDKKVLYERAVRGDPPRD